MFTTQQTRITNAGELTVSVKANGGSLLIEAKIADEWAAPRTISEDDVVICGGRNVTYRFTPAGGAAYDIN